MKTNYIISYLEDFEWRTETLKGAKECAEYMKALYGSMPTIYKIKLMSKGEKHND